MIEHKSIFEVTHIHINASIIEEEFNQVTRKAYESIATTQPIELGEDTYDKIEAAGGIWKFI